MIINERRESLDRVKEVKVKIPVTYHVKLHSMKVLTGKQISDAVTEALEFYFQHKRSETLTADMLAADLSTHAPHNLAMLDLD